MRTISVVAALVLSAIAAPASAAFTLTIDPTVAYGTRTLNIYATNAGTVCGQSPCSGSGSFFYETIARTLFPAPQIADGPNGELRFRFQDRAKSDTFVTLVFGSAGYLLSSSLSGFVELNAPCLGSICQDETATYTAQSFAVTLTDTETGISRILAPVPEPSTWAMMLVGFGAIGLRLRRKQRTLLRHQTT